MVLPNCLRKLEILLTNEINDEQGLYLKTVVSNNDAAYSSENCNQSDRSSNRWEDRSEEKIL